jgi:hypothetical protein
MKKIFLAITIIATSINVNAQSFTVTSDTIEGNFDVSQYPSDYNYVVNTSGADMAMSFDLLTNTLPDAGWTVTLCTHQFCMPSVPTTASFGTLADGGQGYFNVHVGFNNTPGDGEISFRIYETSNPSNADTIVFLYHGTSSLGIGNIQNGVSINLYPNPTNDFITVSGLDFNTNSVINIYGLDGSLISSNIASSSSEVINVNDFQNGVYFMEVRKSGKLLYRSKFIKN